MDYKQVDLTKQVEVSDKNFSTLEEFEEFLESQDFFVNLKVMLQSYTTPEEATEYYELVDWYEESHTIEEIKSSKFFPAFEKSLEEDPIVEEDEYYDEEENMLMNWRLWLDDSFHKFVNVPCLWVDDYVAVREFYKNTRTGHIEGFKYIPFPLVDDVVDYGFGEYVFNDNNYINDYEDFIGFYMRCSDNIMVYQYGDVNVYDNHQIEKSFMRFSGFATFAGLIFLAAKHFIEKSDAYDELLDCVKGNDSKGSPFVKRLFQEWNSMAVVLEEVSFDDLEIYDGKEERELMKAI